MSARRKKGPQDKSAMRDLSGRRMKAVQQAKELANYLAKAPALERKAREERRRKLEGILAADPARGIKMDDHVYWEDRERLVDGVQSAVREAVRGSVGKGAVVEGRISVSGGGVKRDVKFAGFDEDFEDSSEDEDVRAEDVDVEDEEETGAEEEDIEEERDEEEYEESTEEETPTEE
jgi:Silencing defective 2 N-terminal ubiquitin domain